MNQTWWVNSKDLDADQQIILQADRDDKLLIIGPPGSGKTNILLLRANYVRSKHPRLLFITFTRTLTEFIRSGPSIGRDNQIKKDEISTFMAWGQSLLRNVGFPYVSSHKDFKKERRNLIKSLQEYIDSSNPGKLYDAVFIDEVQDFWKSEIDVLSRLSHTINGAGDIRQTIWGHREGLPAMRLLSNKEVELVLHYRIGLNICKFADRILPPRLGDAEMAENSKYDEAARPSSVLPNKGKDDSEQFAKCLYNIKEQLRYITDEPILVLAYTTAVRNAFWEALEEDGEIISVAMLQSSEGYEPFGPESLVRVMTIASAKGSEARAVHILRADGLKTDKRELAFTAVTRAKTEVNLYHTSPLPGHLEPQKDEYPDLEAIF